MVEPAIAQKAAYKVDLQPADYYWCACGKSGRQPFCDGAHKGSEFSPVKFTITQPGTFYLCGCKRSARKPYCDRTHKKLG